MRRDGNPRARGVWALFALLATSVPAYSATPVQALIEEARVLHDSFEFEACLQRLELAVPTDSSRAELVEIRIYRGLCQYSLGQSDASRESFRTALRLSSSARLPEGTSPKLLELFNEVLAELPPAPPPTSSGPPRADLLPDALAPPPVSIPKAEVAARPSIPLGVPIGLSALSATSVVGGALLAAAARANEGRANAALYDSDRGALGDQARSQAMWANVAIGVAVASAAAAVATLLLRIEW